MEEEASRASAPSALEENLSRDGGYDSLNGIGAKARNLLIAPGPAAPGARGSAAVGGKPDALVHVLVALTAVLLMGRLLSPLFRGTGQPPVIGEVVGGILLGPSLLG